MLRPLTLPLPALPEALVGLKLLVVADPHVRRPRRRHDAVIRAAADARCDVLLLLGDYMDKLGDEPAAQAFMDRLVEAAAPRYGSVGVFGNHDSPTLRRRLEHGPVLWLQDAAHALAPVPMTFFGLTCGRDERRRPSADLLATLLDEPPYFDAGHRLRVMLSHLPTTLPQVADTHIDLMLSGHTHGGQVRLPRGRILYNATPGWPLEHSAGVFQLRRTRCIVSRGVGETTLDGLRLNCPPHMPLITLTRMTLDDPAPISTPALRVIERW